MTKELFIVIKYNDTQYNVYKETVFEDHKERIQRFTTIIDNKEIELDAILTTSIDVSEEVYGDLRDILIKEIYGDIKKRVIDNG